MCNIFHELVGDLNQRMFCMAVTLVHDKDLIRCSSGIALIFKVTALLKRSNLSIYGGRHLFSLKQ